MAGLFIVALSVNVDRIITTRAPIAGARSTIASLVLAIAVSLLILPPELTMLRLGIVTLVLTIIAGAIQLAAIIAQWNLTAEGVTAAIRVTILGLAIAEHLPFLLGGVLLVAGEEVGMWGLAIGIIMVVMVSMVNAWVLLIEVRR